MEPENISDDGEEGVGLGQLLEGTEVFNFMEKISSTLSYWTKRGQPHRAHKNPPTQTKPAPLKNPKGATKSSSKATFNAV